MAEKSEVMVETASGKIQGFQKDGLNYFRGIPYAAPPVGNLRWLPPHQVKPWSGVRKAEAFGSIAHQPKGELELLLSIVDQEARTQKQDEDCLYLNVTSPGLDGAKRPVMVWIHGGAFRTGSGSHPFYDSPALSRRGDVVVVTINYRLGPLGFLNLNEITKGRIPSTGNEGLLDQVAALKWVQENIETFGGDPENVTLFGESAGGASVGCLLTLPAARGLFQKAIPQSGAAHISNPLEKAVLISENFLDILGLIPEKIDALLAVPPDQLIKAAGELALRGQTTVREIGGMPLQPIVDGKVLPKMPFEAVKEGTARGIPVLVGSTLEEWKLFAAMDPRVAKTDEALLIKRCRRLIPGGDAEAIITSYREARTRRGEPAGPVDLFVALQTDRIFRIPALRLAEEQGRQGSPAYVYLFTWPSPFNGGQLGSCHALELGFLFGTHEEKFFGSGPAADTLAREIQDAWLAFAQQGDPSNKILGTWPVYSESKETMILGRESGLQKTPYEQERQSWDTVPDNALGFL
ncbi:MAG: carboxylesterase/lipase family protein [Thermodesulfobacteriota bacterium]